MPTGAAPHPSDERIIWDIVELHLDEAEFLFELWESALDAPNYSLADLAARPEERLLAHLDALEITGPAAIDRLLLPTIEDPEADYERVVAAVLAMWKQASEQQRARVLAVLTGEAEDEQRRGIVRALELVDDPGLAAKLVQAISSAGTPGTAAALETLARRRAPIGDWIGQFLRSDDPRVARAAALAVRHCPDPRALDGLAPLAQSDEPDIRKAAIETALWRQVPGAWELALYWAFVPGDSPFRRDALTWVASLGDETIVQRMIGLLDLPNHRVDAVWALGASGRISAVDRCVDLLDDPELAQLAAEVVCAIAGLSTHEDEYWHTPVVDDDDEDATLPGLHEDRRADELVPEPEDALPWPNAAAIRAWWQARRGDLDDSTRYLGGTPMTGVVVLEALRDGPLRRRHALAFELGVRTAGEIVIGTRGLSARQRSELDTVQLAEVICSEAARFHHHPPAYCERT